VKDQTLAKDIEFLELLQHRTVRFIAKLKDQKLSQRHALSLTFSLSNRDAGLTDSISSWKYCRKNNLKWHAMVSHKKYCNSN